MDMHDKEAAVREATEILAEQGIKNSDDLYTKSGDELAIVFETLKSGVLEKYDLSDENMEDILEEILG